MADVNSTIRYDSRFIFDSDDKGQPTVIADRSYNIQSICRATMGAQAVRNLPGGGQNDPDHISLVLSPEASAGAVFVADLRIGRRHFEADESDAPGFNVVEVVRQVVTSTPSQKDPAAPPSPRPPPRLKDIDTTTLYTKVSEDRIEAIQRTASFAVSSPSTDPAMARVLYDLGNAAVDVRTYKLVYTLRRRLQPPGSATTSTPAA